jgi:hypothetical protein
VAAFESFGAKPSASGKAHNGARQERTLPRPTELIDQIYLGMVAARERDWRNRQHLDPEERLPVNIARIRRLSKSLGPNRCRRLSNCSVLN